MGRVDVLVNNSAIDYDSDQRATAADLERVEERGRPTRSVPGGSRVRSFRYCAALARESSTSQAEPARLARAAPAPSTYRVPKAAPNALTRILAAELRGERILVNAVCPGSTATDMGGGGRPAAAGVASVVWAALLDDDGPTGGFFRDSQALAW